MATTGSQDQQVGLAEALRDFWEDYTGNRPGDVRVVADARSIAVWLKEVLSPAERELALTHEGLDVLRKYEVRVLEQAKTHLRHLVEKTVDRRNILVEVQLDAASGSVLGFFQLE